ncbi:hypothetical protein E2C01_084709 [Portunus trituberculatus]|uniref:Uncharacterized protein n=1 Tax=Portunus trituberculatus TaxID=210409 RepID=A0A5B7IZ03_PORTR|nr:hypothetical protein [Portunus trituberculatus]
MPTLTTANPVQGVRCVEGIMRRRRRGSSQDRAGEGGVMRVCVPSPAGQRTVPRTCQVGGSFVYTWTPRVCFSCPALPCITPAPHTTGMTDTPTDSHRTTHAMPRTRWAAAGGQGEATWDDWQGVGRGGRGVLEAVVVEVLLLTG